MRRPIVLATLLVALLIRPLFVRAQGTAADDFSALLQRAAVAETERYAGLQHLVSTVSKRVSAAASAGPDHPARLVSRHESAARIEFQAPAHYRIALLGSRTAQPAGGEPAAPESHAEFLGGPPLPVLPGEDLFWFSEGLRQHLGVDPGRFVHPLGPDAERMYRRTAGDSVRIATPDGLTRRLREVRVTPRQRSWQLIEGSLWLDVESGALVAAQYRLAGAVESSTGESASLFARATVTIDHVVLEFALVEGRWWLPRLQSIAARGSRLGMIIDVTVQQRYDAERASSASVSGAPDVVTSPGRDQCRTSDVWQETATRRNGTLTLLVTRPCDRQQLVSAAELPADIFAEDAAFFGRALGGALQRPTAGDRRWSAPSSGAGLRWGPGLLRFDRIQGLSAAVEAETETAGRMRLQALLRYGLGDRTLRGSVGATRAGWGGAVGARAYRLLATATDFDDPGSRTASLAAAIFGRDPRLYYGAAGVALTGDALAAGRLDLRVYVEEQRSVLVTQRSALFGVALPSDNAAADDGTWLGVRARLRSPRRDSPIARLRVEPQMDLDAARGLGSANDYALLSVGAAMTAAMGPRVALSLQLRGSSSLGEVPAQRLVPLGGPRGVRGQDPELARGDALWLARTEVGVGTPLLRPVIFFDAGWAGSRRDWHRQAPASTGAGIGVSFLDGLLRLDLSRGVRPTSGQRVDLLVEVPF